MLIGQRLRPVLRYHGGKWRLAPWIISHFPPHRVYVEPFGGGGSVLMRKPRTYAEVYNDLDGEVVNVFKVLRNPKSAADLRAQLALTPFSRVEFTAAYQDADDPVEQARRTLIKSFMGFGSAAITQQATNDKPTTGFRSNSNKSGSTPAHDWANLPDFVSTWCERLAGVVIECDTAPRIIDRFDTLETLFYLDPPYVHSTRDSGDSKGKRRYRFEMTDAEHEQLASQLTAIKGMAVVSGYSCDLYESLFHGWRKVSIDSHADGARDRVESLWINPAATARMAGLLEVA